ncbi:hypothetical protein C0J52_26371 [Blattella germanica]|nr:hypothetical protein C0J52_26371 [Blattella germanica]
MKYLNKSERDNASINNVKMEDWIKYYKELWTTANETDTLDTKEEESTVDLIDMEELEEILNTFKNKKSPGSEELNMN